jgi:hypothetical protein
VSAAVLLPEVSLDTAKPRFIIRAHEHEAPADRRSEECEPPVCQRRTTVFEGYALR